MQVNNIGAITPRKNIAIAIDGGGIKGLIVAQGLVALEKALTGDQPLITHPDLKILIGTSTGAIITAGIALGMRAKDIVELYLQLGDRVFPSQFPKWFPRGMKVFLSALRGLVSTSQYSNTAFIELIRETVKTYGLDADLTLGALGKRLRSDQALIITTVEISDRRTHFLKTYNANDRDLKLWEAVLVSSSAPTIFPVYTKLPIEGFYIDGGVGAQGNPAYIAAQEAVAWNRLDPAEVTVFSFGTGWLSAKNFVAATGRPDQWNILDWAQNTTNVIIQDVARSQSVDLINNYVRLDDFSKGMDFRRFQIPLETDIDAFGALAENNAIMLRLGDHLGQRILNGQHALVTYPVPNSDYDPEGLIAMVQTVKRSQSLGGANTMAQSPQQEAYLPEGSSVSQPYRAAP